MGTTLVKEAATKTEHVFELQALQIDEFIESFAKDLIQNIQETFPDHSNIQKNNCEPGFEAKAAQKASNDDFFAGYANSEHVVKLLQDCSHEKYFRVFTDEGTAKFTKIQQVRILLLYTIFVHKSESTFTQEAFSEYFDKFMSAEDAQSDTTRKNVGLNTGLRFALSLLQEIHSIGAPLLENSLRNLYKALCDAPAGSLYGIDIFAFQQDATLNEARNFLASLVQDKTKNSKSLIELCLKTIVRLGVARSSAEDLLLAVKLINADNDLGKNIDLRDEIKSLSVPPKINMAQTKKVEEVKKEQPKKVEPPKPPMNRAGAIMTPSRQNGELYCGRILGQHIIPFSDGQCGPNNGPQCPDCRAGPVAQPAPKESKVSVEENTSAKSNSLLQENRGKIKANLRYSSQINLENYCGHSATNGKTIYYNYEGILTTSCPKDPSDTIFTYTDNREKVPEWKSLNPMMYLNDKLYMRLPEHPFAVFDPETLQMDLKETEAITRTLVLQETQNNLQWLSDFDPSSNNRFMCGPFFTDGNSVYCMSMKNEEGRNYPDLFIETFCPTDWRHLKTVQLFSSTGQPFWQKKYSVDEFLTKISLLTNGTYLMLCQDKKRHLFDLESGHRVEKQKADHFNGRVIHDYLNNRFLSFVEEEQDQYQIDFTIDALKIQKRQAKVDLNSENDKNLIQKFKEQYLAGYDATPIQNTRHRLIHGAIKQTPIAQEPLPFNSGSLVTSILLNYVAQSCEQLQAEFTKLDNKTNPSDKYLMFFHWPGATYLTELLFDCLRRLLNNFKTLIKSKKTSENIADQQSFLSTIQILDANMKSLNFCGMKLNEIFLDDSDFQSFVNAFKDSILYLTENGLPQDDGSDMKTCGNLWYEIQETCKNVMSSSISMLYSDAKDVLQKLATTLSQENLSPVEQNSCGFKLQFLTNSVSKLLNFENATMIESLLMIIKSLEKMQSSNTIQIIQAQKPFEELVKLPKNLALQQACDSFEQSLYEQILVSLEKQNIELFKKADKTTAGKTKRFQIETNVKQLLNLIPAVFVNLCNRTASAFTQVLDSVQQAVSFQEFFTEETYKAFGFYCNRIHSLVTSPQKTNLLMLYVTSLSQICVDQPQMISAVTCGLTLVIESAIKLQNYLQENQESLQGKDSVENKFSNTIKELIRKSCWLVGSLSFNLIRVNKLSETTDPKEKMIRMLMESKVLSGGMESRFLPTLDKDTKEKLLHTLEISNDKLSLEILKNDRVIPNDEDKLLNKLMRQSGDEGVERLIDLLQICIENPMARQPHARLHGSAGMTISRVTFAVMIKYSQLTDSVEEAINSIECEFDEQDESLSRVDKLNAVRLNLQNDNNFKKVLQEWTSASRIRKWITEKKLNLSLKIEKAIRERYYKRKAAQAAAVQSNEMQIDTSDAKEIENSEITKLIDTQMEKDLNDIFQKVMAKAEFLLQLQVPTSYKVFGNIQLQKTKSSREQDEIALEMENEGWKDRLLRWKSMQKTQAQEVQQQQLQKQVIEQENNAIMAVLEAAVTVDVIKKFVQEDFIKTTLRISGLQLLQKVISLPIEAEVATDLTNWFKVSLSGHTNKLSHYVSNIKCRGNFSEDQLRKYFFLILKSILDKIKESRSSQNIIRLLDALKWKFMGKDHTALVELNIFKCLREGDGSNDHPIKKVWGKKIDENVQPIDVEPGCLQLVLMETFEFLVFNIVGRIIDTELGQEIQLKKDGTGTHLPTLERRKSLITTSVSESLVSQAFSMLFKEFSRYIDVFRKFGGINYQSFVNASNKHTIAKSEQRFANEFSTELLFDMEDLSQNKQKEDPVDSIEFMKEVLNELETNTQKQIHKIYDGSYLRRLLRLIDMFISIAKSKQPALTVVKSITDPNMIMILIDLFGYVESRNQLLILRIVRNLISVGLSTDQFDASMMLLKATKQTAFQAQSEIKFNSQFLTFWFGHLHNMRSAMFTENIIANYGAYEVTQEIGRLFNTIQLKQDTHYQDWCLQIKESLANAYLRFEKLSSLDQDVILSLEPGADFNRISIGSPAMTDDNQLVTVLGFQTKQNEENQQKFTKIEHTFTDAKQMAICLYNDNNHKEKQEIIQLAPHGLTPVYSLDSEVMKTLAQNSALMKPEVLKRLMKLISDKDQPSGLKVQILKAFSQLSRYAPDFMDILKQNDLLQPLISDLFSIRFNSVIDNKKTVQDPVSWLEAKVTNMRVHAIENLASLQTTTSMKCQVIKKQQLAFSYLDKETGYNISLVALIISAVNLNTVTETTQYHVETSNRDNFKCKGNIRFVEQDQMSKLDSDLLKIMKSTEAIVTHDVKVKDFVQNLVTKVSAEQSGEDWSQVFQCVVYVIDKAQFDNIRRKPQASSFFSESKLFMPQKTVSSFADFRKVYESWAGIHFDQIMEKICDLEDQTMDGVRKALPTIVDKIQKKDDSDEEEDPEMILFRLMEEGNEAKINAFLDEQSKQQEKPKKRVEEKKAVSGPFEFKESEVIQATVDYLINYASKEIETECKIFDILEGDQAKISSVVRENFVQNKEKEENNKKQNNPSSSYLSTITDFSTKSLAKAYEQTFQQLLQEYTSFTIWAMLNSENIQTLMPVFLQNPDQRILLQSFLKARFHWAENQFKNTGSKIELKAVKSFIRKLFDFCLNQDSTGKGKDFVQMFLHDNILRAGGFTLNKIQKSSKQEAISAHFETEQDSIEGLNPNLLIFIIKVALELRLTPVLESQSYLPALMGLAIGMFSWYWRPTETEVPQKLLKQCQNIVFFTQEYLETYIKSGVALKIINCPMITHIVKQIDYSDSGRLSTVQKLLLEVYLSLIDLKEEVEVQLGQKVDSILSITQQMIDVRRSLTIVKEQLNSKFLQYWLHQNTLSNEQRELLDQKLVTMHPHFDVQVKAKLSFEDIQSLDLMRNSQTQLKGMSCIGISDRSDGKDMKLYNQKDLVESDLKHGSGELYLFYPVEKQTLVQFGDNRRNRMGETGDSQLPTCSSEFSKKIKSQPIQVECNRFSTFVLTDSRELYATGGCYNIQNRCNEFTRIEFPPGEVPERIFEGRRSRWVITNSGKTYFSGMIKTSEEWPRQRQPTFDMKEFKLSTEANFDQKIVDIACGSFYHAFLTDKGQIWAIGERILERVNNTNRDIPQIIALPSDDLIATGVWVSQDKRCPVIIANLKSKTTGHTILYSVGYGSDRGILGQGGNIQESKQFVKVDYDPVTTSFVNVSISDYSVLAIDQNGDLWSWGKNIDGSIGHPTNLASEYFKPTKILLFQDLGLKALNISMGRRHGLILAKETNGQVSLWSMGQNTSFTHCFGVPVEQLSRSLIRKIEGLAGSQIIDFYAAFSFSMVIVGGSELTETLYQHQLPEEKKAQGVLHAYQRDGKWHYMSQEEYESTNGANLPEICIAFKCPIPELDTVMNGPNPLIKDDLISLLSDQSSSANVKSSYSHRQITGVVYSASAQINGEQLNVNLSENEMLKETTKFDVNPLIYYRLVKPLKEGKILPLIDLAKVYKTTEQFGFDINVKADFGYSYNKKLIEITKKDYELLCNSLDNFPKEADEELQYQMDRQVSEHERELQIDHYNKYKVKDMTWEKFSKINSVSQQSIENRMKFIWCYNYFFVQLEGYMTPTGVNRGFKGQKINKQSAASISSKAKHLILSSVKLSFVRRAIERLQTGEECREVQVSRDEAMRFIESGQVDNSGEFTMFGQIFKQLNGKYDCWKHNNVDARALRVKFLNEASTDAGGPFRETLTNFVTEMESGALPLLVMTENHKNNYGDNRDNFMLNADSTMPTHQAMFKFLGVLIGFAFRTGSCIPFNFAPIVWKQIVGEQLKEIDLKANDTFTWQNFKDLRKNAVEIQSEEEFESIVDQYFTYTKNGKTIELCKNGSTRKVNQSNLEEFIQLTYTKIFEQGLQQAKWIQDGLQIIISREIVNMLSWKDVEERVCGAKSTNVEKLKEITEYEYCSEESPVCRYFWNVMRRMSEANKSAYLKFVWGRKRLPTDLSNLSRKHKIKVIDSWSATRLPESHTCFFAIDIPNYTSEEQLEQKLMISIEFCGEIDNDR